MKSLKQYISESVHIYEYTIKIAGEIDKKFTDAFKTELNKFDVVDMTVSETPIQKDPYGFPGMSNMSVNIFKCRFRYPATEPMIVQIAELLGYDPNKVRMIDTKYNDSINDEVSDYDSQPDVLIGSDEQPSTEKMLSANKAYGDMYLTDIKKYKESRPKNDQEYSVKPTEYVYDPFKPEDSKSMSPMSKINLPERPATSASKKSKE
jgi:hypothetical protein